MPQIAENRFTIFAADLAMATLALACLLILGAPTLAHAWPTDSQWIPIPKGGNGILDDHTSGGKNGDNDANGGVNIVPYSGATPAAYTYNDGTYLHFRLRLDARPDGGGNGILAQFGWGVEIDTDQNADDYEWLIMCDGISSPEVVSLQENTDKLGIGDPSDKAEVTVATWPMPGNHRILLAPTTINGDPDYFLDFRIAYNVFKSATGITDNTMVRYFIGSSRSTNNLTDNGADLLSGTDLYSMATDFITPFGSLPPGATFYDGTVKFTTDLNGATVRTVGAPDDTLYLRIDDLDLNSNTLPGGKITVTVTSPTGDSERVTLTAAGVAGKYTGTLATSTSSSGSNSGTLYVLSGQTVTVTYIDAIAANRTQSVPRTATLFLTSTGTDVALSKSVDLPTAGEGTLVTFTVVATNLGPNAVTSLTVTDLLPAGLTYVSHSGPGSYLSGSGAWTPGGITVGNSATLTLRATVNAGTSGSVITNTASRTASNPADAFAGNDTASAQVAVGGTDLRVTKLVDNPVPVPGGTIVYTVRATNLGPNATGGVVVRDILPAGVTYVSDSGGGAYNPGTGDWGVGTLTSGQTAQLDITVTVNSGTTGQTITNTASLLASTQPDTNPANNSASVPILVGFTDLRLIKTARKITPPVGVAGDSVAANVGDSVDFTITVQNNGPHAATGINVTDLLPVGVTYVSHTASQGAYVSGTGLWTLGGLANSAAATLTIQVTVNAGTIGQTLINTATITAVDQPDSNPGNESDDASISVNGTDLDITKTVNNPTPNPGNVVVWTVTVRNNGPNQATGVAVTDILPAGITRVNHTASPGTSWSATGGNPSWIWTIGTLNVGSSVTLVIDTTVNAGTTGQTITNTAMITGANQADPESANNVASAKIAVSGTDLAMTKTVNNPTPNVGDVITYTLQVTNNGPNNATGVAVTDLLPPEVTYQSHAGGSYTPATGLWSIGNLNSGTSTTLTITARVNNGNNGLAITNTASITAVTQGDPNLANNSASAVVNVGSTNLSVTKTVSNAAPTVSAPFTYTVTVANAGVNAATGVELEDVLPATVTQSGYTASQGTFSGGLWLVGTLNPGASAALQITASANAGTAGTTITNTARLQRLNQIDTNAADNIASVNIVPTQSGDLSTSTKAVLDLNGGDVLAGETLRYTITLRETDGTPANNVRVTDHIPANVDTFTVVSIPAGATNASTGAGTGTNGTGFLDITGINIPASGSATIVFTVRANGPNGATIANTANVSNPGGIGGTAVAPTLIIAASSVPASGTKQLYLQEAINETVPATPRFLKRTPITSVLGVPRVRIRRTDPAVSWNLTPALQTSLTLNPNFSVVLLMTDEDAANNRDLELTLSYDSGGGPVNIAQQNFTGLNIADFLPTAYTFNLASAGVTIPAGSLITLSVRNSTPGATSLPIYVFPYFNANTSRVELNSATVINVDSIGFFSDVAYPGGAPLASVGPGTTVRIRSTISDPFGSADITSAVVTITDPLGVVTVNQAAMTQVFDSTAATKIYEYRYTIPAGGPTGNWNVRVDAREGTEGLVSDYGLAALTVQNLPSFLVSKGVVSSWDPVNGTTGPYAIPGAIVEYTLTITNTGLGSPDNNTILVTDPIPAETELIVSDPVVTISNVPADTGLTISYVAPTDAGDDIQFSTDGADFTYQPTADANGADASVTHIRINPKGVFSASDGVTLPTFSVSFKVRIK